MRTNQCQRWPRWDWCLDRKAEKQWYIHVELEAGNRKRHSDKKQDRERTKSEKQGRAKAEKSDERWVRHRARETDRVGAERKGKVMGLGRGWSQPWSPRLLTSSERAQRSEWAKPHSVADAQIWDPHPPNLPAFPRQHCHLLAPVEPSPAQSLPLLISPFSLLCVQPLPLNCTLPSRF